ncbi:hypothetical protein FQB35_12490 [Crassaminicella thermophila]|uniref:Uncharacterized protein n=1 Tax=Crassaminicella thermophila TaxID=2599308 RepID=A0A5C0SFD3_CRATE|nr:hypothetical protein FQB35_12490 [Crassaminicella thermophila]
MNDCNISKAFPNIENAFNYYPKYIIVFVDCKVFFWFLLLFVVFLCCPNVFLKNFDTTEVIIIASTIAAA